MDNVITLVFFLFVLLVPTQMCSQEDTFYSKCGPLTDKLAQEQLSTLGDHWGYGYDDLLLDISKWEKSPYINIDSIGASVQGRAIWELKITSDKPQTKPRKTVYIHVRTHPNEVQGFWVANEMISYLQQDNDFADYLRNNCVFYFVPMYNPDGVELEYPRQNANKLDIERNWSGPNFEPEVKALKRRFETLMLSESPIEVALNFHSAYACKRYFVYHDEAGTNSNYALLEKDFINGVKSYYDKGIEPWNYYVSWKNGAVKKFPEGWWWFNHKSNVLALTYEDGNCEAAGNYDKTSFAILHGLADYLGLVNTLVLDTDVQEHISLKQNFPNPIRSKLHNHTMIQYHLINKEDALLELLDASGNLIRTLVNSTQSSGKQSLFVDVSDLKPGIYYYRLSTKSTRLVKKMIVQ